MNLRQIIQKLNVANSYDVSDAKEMKLVENELKNINEIMQNHNCSNLSELNSKLCDYEELKFDDDLNKKNNEILRIIKEYKLIIYNKIEDAICTRGYVHNLPQTAVNLLKEWLK